MTSPTHADQYLKKGIGLEGTLKRSQNKDINLEKKVKIQCYYASSSLYDQIENIIKKSREKCSLCLKSGCVRAVCGRLYLKNECWYFDLSLFF